MEVDHILDITFEPSRNTLTMTCDYAYASMLRSTEQTEAHLIIYLKNYKICAFVRVPVVLTDPQLFIYIMLYCELTIILFLFRMASGTERGNAVKVIIFGHSCIARLASYMSAIPDPFKY